MRAILLMALFTLTLSGCGPSDSDIKKAGFSNAAEMKKANAEPFQLGTTKMALKYLSIKVRKKIQGA